MGYTNSSLVSYTKISPNKTSPRNHVIDTITIHCMAGNLSVETCGNVFAPTSKQASSNYGIGSDGRIALYVEEKDRSWCSSNATNDHRAVTIEVANDGGEPDWHVSDRAMASLIELVADICKRNNIKELKWKADKSLIGQIDKQNMTVHRWFAAKSCPGEYLYSRHGQIANEVNKRLGIVSSQTSTPSTPSTPTNKSFPTAPFTVTVIVPDLNYRSDASMSGIVKGVTGKGVFTITEVKNGWGKLKSGLGWIYLENASYVTIGSTVGGSNTSTASSVSQSSSATYTETQFIKDVQAAIGAKADGIAGSETLSKTVTVSKTKNNKHAVVKPIQKYLNAQGFSCGTEDGIAGTKFDAAVKAYQKNHGCAVDGEITAQKNTWKSLLGLR